VCVATFSTKTSPPSEEDAEDDKLEVKRPVGPNHLRTYIDMHEKSTVELLKKDLNSLSGIYALSIMLVAKYM
jgi:hypothetical protein